MAFLNRKAEKTVATFFPLLMAATIGLQVAPLAKASSAGRWDKIFCSASQHFLWQLAFNRGFLPYETNSPPYFDQFPVIEVTPLSASQWARCVYRSDLARYGELWTRQTWWIYQRIKAGLETGGIQPKSGRPLAIGAVLSEERPKPVQVVNPFTADVPLDGTHGPVSEHAGAPSINAALVNPPRVLLSSGPLPKRMLNPFCRD